jgi:hypothetical protein
MQTAGNHTSSWDFIDPTGNPSGIYILKTMIQYDNLTVIQEKKIVKINKP